MGIGIWDAADLYSCLGLHRSAGTLVIEHTYKAKALKYRPDKRIGYLCRNQQIDHAFAVLSDPEARKKHDDALRRKEVYLLCRNQIRTLITRRTYELIAAVKLVMLLTDKFEQLHGVQQCQWNETWGHMHWLFRSWASAGSSRTFSLELTKAAITNNIAHVF